MIRKAGGGLNAAALAAAVLAGVAGCGGGAEGSIDPKDAAQVARGEALYRTHCAACHGAKLEGQPEWRQRKADGRLPAPPHDASGHTWHHPNELLVNITRDGMVPPWAPEGYASDMPAFARVLSDDEIRATLAFIQSTWPAEVWPARAQMAQQRR
ncbi:putative cytochrome c [Azoarcus sp. CIB]|uniref:c-type cytochrome n=1 Tax=Aromatoleum sp. (strain CIB) TaxID=198107 RepID=UPI00067CE60A|nr:cytochrome c [Azoarcus sp. CIB]AKU13851.1 putative cytochrome c [Azoarcus sp. CIB]